MTELEIADALAQDLVKRRVDPNEVASALAVLRNDLDGPRFFRYLDAIISDGEAVVRSGRTLEYYRILRRACKTYLAAYRDQPQRMAYTLGWAIRLMRFYRVEGLPTERFVKRQGQSRPNARSSASAVGGRQSGRVKFFDANRNFGFITPDKGGKDVFVHRSKLASGLTTLSNGQRVTYEVGQGRKGPEARNVRPE